MILEKYLFFWDFEFGDCYKNNYFKYNGALL